MPPKAKNSVEVPTYADLFPELDGPANAGQQTSIWSTATGAVKPSTTTQVFQIALEEQKLATKPGAFPGQEARQMRKVVGDVMDETGAQIDLSHSRDDTLCVVVSGKSKAVLQAKTLLLKRLQKQAEKTIQIPPEHYASIIGRKGETLKGIQEQTSTRIWVPNADSEEDVIRVTGTMEGVQEACDMIQDISDTEAKRARVKLEILKAYQPLIAGFKNETIKRIAAATGANIHFPPSSKDVDEIVVSGEKLGVHQAVEELKVIYDMKRRTCGELIAQVKKSQHKYIIGPRGAHLDEIMQEFCVVVEIPPQDTDNETIILRGSQEQLVHALTRMYELAGSMTSDSFAVPGWLHKHIIGRKGSNLAVLTKDMKKVQINFDQETGMVELEGPPDEVAALKTIVESLARELIAKMSFETICVAPEFHARLIGKGGNIINKIKKDTETQINFPDSGATEDVDVIRIEGQELNVAIAKAQILAIADKLRDSRKIDVIIPQKYHAAIIGKSGAHITKMIAEIGDIQINVPSSKDDSEIITLAGHKDVVAQAEKYLQKFVKDFEAENFQLEVEIFKAYHSAIIGTGGSVINKIKAETKTKIDIPDKGSDAEAVTVTGVEANVKKARDMLLKIQNDIAIIVSDTVSVPTKLHEALGKVATAIGRSNGGVIIKFPESGSTVTIRGPEEDVATAKASLSKLASAADGGRILGIIVPRAHHRVLIGREGAAVAKMQEELGVTVIFPPLSRSKKSDETVTIFGAADAVQSAKKAIDAKVNKLENVTTATIDVAKKYQKQMMNQRAQFLQEMRAEFEIDVQLPKDRSSETVTLHGPSDEMDACKARIAEFIQNIDDQVTVDCIIPYKEHRSVIGPGGVHVTRITATHRVKIDFPKKPDGIRRGAPKQAPAPANGEGADEPPAVSKYDKVKISGLQANCDAAAEELTALVPVSDVMEIEADYHRFIIGSKGEAVRKLMQTHDVFIKFPNSGSTSTQVTIKGPAEKIAGCRTVLEARVKELDADKEERALRNFKVHLSVNPKMHQKLIGKAGSNVIKLRDEYGVQIDFPKRDKKLSKEAAKKITITGFEDKATACGAAMTAQVEDWASMVLITVHINPKCHRRVIGKGGETIRELQGRFKARILMPRDDPNGPIKIEAAEANAIDCKDALLDLEEEYLQDQDDYEEDSQYVKPERKWPEPEKKQKKVDGPSAGPNSNGGGFNVKGAPWQGKKEAKNFPGLGSAPKTAADNGAALPGMAAAVWGGARK